MDCCPGLKIQQRPTSPVKPSRVKTAEARIAEEPVISEETASRQVVKLRGFAMARASESSMDDKFDTMETRTRDNRNVVVINLDAQRPHTHSFKDNGLRGEELTATPRNSTAEPSARSYPTSRRPTDRDSPFSCRRWRKLTGKVPEPDDEVRPVVRLAHPPSHWSSSMQTKGFVSAFPSAPPSADHSSASPRSKGGQKKLQWKEIDRFEPRVMKKLVDKAYGINARHHTAQQFPLQHGNRDAQRQFIRSQVYLPSVHRTLDYLEKAREVLPTLPTSRASPPRPVRPAPARLGAKLLSSQLQDLQVELLVHYEAERVQGTVSGSLGLQQDGRLWSPQPPPHPPTPCLAASSSSSSSSVRNHSNSGSFRSLRHGHSKSFRDSASDNNEDDTATEEEAMVLTDSDTYSLSSGVEADSETESLPRLDAEASESSGTASWCSLASHVILALEGTDAAQVGSVREPLIMSYDSDDVALFAESTNSSTRDASVSSGSTASLPVFETTEDEHVMFVDNGVRVNSAGQVVEENDLAFALAMLMQDIDREEGTESEAESIVDVRQAEEREDSVLDDLQRHDSGVAEEKNVEISDAECDCAPQGTPLVQGMKEPTATNSLERQEDQHNLDTVVAGDEKDERAVEDVGLIRDAIAIERRVADDEEQPREEQRQPGPSEVSPVEEHTTPPREEEESTPMAGNHDPELDADVLNEQQDAPLDVTEPAEAIPEDRASSRSSSRPRLSITSETHYDDADFEDLEMNEAESDQGYESFED